MSILINPKNTFPIYVTVAVQAGGVPKYFAALTSDTVALAGLPADLPREEHTFTFRPTDFKINTMVVDAAIENRGAGVRIHGATLRFNRVLKTLVEWTLKDDKGDLIPVTEANISALPQAVATVLSDELDKMAEGI